MKKLFKVFLTFGVIMCLMSCGKKVNVVATSETEKTEVLEIETTNETVKETETQTLEKMETKVENENVLEQESEGEKVVDSNNVEISIKDYGTIKLELDPVAAPITVANFKKLVSEGFYDGLTFHRIIKGFMIQGGDPKGNGTGGSSETIKGEFAGNGIDNPLKHERGVISMARSMDPDSASSQFFIMHETSPHLDGSYAAFGKVTSGIEVVDAICDKVRVQDGNGTVAASDQPVIEYIKFIE